MKRVFFIINILLLAVNGLFSQNVKLTAQAPSTVYVNRPFQLVYVLNADGDDLKTPDFSVFELLAGPFTSYSSNTQWINGKTSSSVQNSFTYTLMAHKEGTFKVPAAYITVKGTKYYSNNLTIKVLPESQAPKGQQQQQQITTRGDENMMSKATSATDNNVFIKMSVSRNNVYEQEGILVTYKLYTLLDVAQFTDMKFPDFQGFLKQEIKQPDNKQLSYEKYNGKTYGTVVLYQVLLFPQHAGQIKIDNSKFTAILRVQQRPQGRHSIFDDFFDSYQNVTKNMVANGATINVKALPTEGKPDGFSGVVGNFDMNTSITSTDVKTNDPITVKVTISGSGNMKLLPNPNIQFPESFETYDPKTDNNFKTSSKGVNGTKTIEYMVIPRHSGEYEIPSAELTYFDVQDRTYKTLHTTPFKINVAKGEGGESVVGNYTDKEDVRQLAKDIRYIDTNPLKIGEEETPFFGTFFYWMLFIIALLIAGILFLFMRKQIKENADIVFVKNKKANKVAQKRLKTAQKLLSEGKKQAFYEEVMKTTWTYLSDKLAIPVSLLNKENIMDKLTNRNVPSDISNQFMNILNTCEFASYAPNTGREEMGNLYDDAVNAISDLEDFLRKK